MEDKKEKQKVVVAALIRNDEGKILLAKRVDPLNPKANGKWEFPGGVVEFGENPEDALIRECREEIGKALIEVHPDSWWFDAKDKWFVDRQEKHRGWNRG